MLKTHINTKISNFNYLILKTKWLKSIFMIRKSNLEIFTQQSKKD